MINRKKKDKQVLKQTISSPDVIASPIRKDKRVTPGIGVLKCRRGREAGEAGKEENCARVRLTRLFSAGGRVARSSEWRVRNLAQKFEGEGEGRGAAAAASSGHSCVECRVKLGFVRGARVRFPRVKVKN